MPMIALIRLANPREILQVYQAIPVIVPIPGVGSLSPPTIGWRGGGEITYQDDGQGNQVAIEGPPRFGISEVTPATVPSGHRIISYSYTLNEDDSITQSVFTEAIPQPSPSDVETLLARLNELETRVEILEGGP